MRALIVLSAVLALSACGSKADDGTDGTTISFDGKSEKGGAVTAGADGKTGKVSINAPGFKGEIELPKIHLDADDFEMNGVKLYPGSKITALNVAGGDGNGDDDDTVRVSFDAPAAPDVVKAWFADKLVKEGDFKLKLAANGLSGTTDEGKPFTMTLTPATDGHASGAIIISGK